MSVCIYKAIIDPIVKERLDKKRSDKAIDFLNNKELIKCEMICNKCSQPLRWAVDSQKTERYVWKCRIKKCKTHMNIKTYSFFNLTELNLPQWIFAMYNFSIGESVANTYGMHEELYSRASSKLMDSFSYLRKICVKYFENNPADEVVGGSGVTVIIDKGQPWLINSTHILCILDLASGKGYLELIRSNQEATMNSIIERVVAEGSTICYINRDSGNYAELEIYRNKYPNVINSINEFEINPHLKQIMWLDRFGGEKAFLTLCDHIKKYYEKI